MNDRVNITTELRAHPNLRKLARALLALAARQQEALALSHSAIKPVPPKAVKPKTGDAA
jgi:hypothetical protein